MARDVANVWWAMFGFSVVVLVVVSALWIYAMLRQPRTHSAEEAKRINRRWIIGGGLVLPTVSIVALLAFGIPTGRSMLPLPVEGEQPLRVQVIGHQWWWEVRYPESGVVTANQFILPIDRPVDVEVTSADVIHSFWVPRLGGKLDMIPGRRNFLRLQADAPGTYGGQCAEYCGGPHALMGLVVVAHEPQAYAAWREKQVGPAAVVASPQAPLALIDQGRAVFGASGCAACHTIRGTEANGLAGPDLTHVGSRQTLGAGILPNNQGTMAGWIADSQGVKPGNRMPSYPVLTGQDLRAVSAYLDSLK
mgnify:CR=1 FL=1